MKLIKIALLSIILIALAPISIYAQTANIQSITTGTSYVRGNHPRAKGEWMEYAGLNTTLSRNIIFSDVIDQNTAWENWQGQPVQIHQGSDNNNYPNTHNHYQNLLSEVMNFKPYTNGVALWGDSAAMTKDAHAWGGITSARSGCDINNPYNPKEGVNCNDFDSQLVGLEVDIVNGGKPGTYPNYSKTGVQVVGFGNKNTIAYEARGEDSGSNLPFSQRKGLFNIGLNFSDAIALDGTMIATWQRNMSKGLELSNTDFNQGILRGRSYGPNTGFIFNDGKGGQVYSGYSKSKDTKQWLSLRNGYTGLRIESNNASKEIVTIDNNGNITFNGNVNIKGRLFVNGKEIK